MCCQCSICKECVCVGQVQELLWMSEWKLKWSTLFLVFFSYVNSCLTSGYYDQLNEIWSILFVNVIITEARVGSGGMNFVVINPIFWIFSVLWYCQYSNVLWGYFHHWLNVMYVYVITHHNTCQNSWNFRNKPVILYMFIILL